MSELRLPSFWRGMSFTNKAGYLCATHQAKDFSDACTILRGLRSPKKKPAQPQVARQPEKLWYNKD